MDSSLKNSTLKVRLTRLVLHFRRALRYHYLKSRNKELIPVPNKLVYRFSSQFLTAYVRNLSLG